MNKRLQVVLAHAGFASRRKVKYLLETGRVMVNDSVITEPGFRVDTEKDLIRVDGKRVDVERKVYLILNKPGNVISTVKDTRRRKTVLDIIKISDKRMYPVGRLDRDTKGLILLTNDGELSYRLTHPKFEIEKVYRVKVGGFIPDKKIDSLRKGVVLDEKKTRPCRIKLIKRNNFFSEFNIMLHEGRKRQIRRMCEAIRHEVLDLERVSYAGLTLGGLRRGLYRPLTKNELSTLKKKVGL